MSSSSLAGQKRWKQADELFISIYPDWRSDPRFPAVCAILGMARGNLEEAERSLSASPESQAMPRDHPAIRRLWAGELDQSLARELQASFPVEWGDYVASVLSADHRYYLLLWQDRLDEATAYAERMVVWMREVGVAPGVWLERRGDALLWLGDVRGAQQSYEDSLKSLPDPDPVYAKLSDVHFALGDLEGERSYREKVYGSLRR